MAGARRVRGRGKAPGARHDRCVLDRCGPRAWRSQPRDTAHGRRARLLRTEFADAVSFFTARAQAASSPASARRTRFLRFAAACAAAAALAGCTPRGEPWRLANVTGHLPDLTFSLTGEDGRPIDASAFRGRAALVYFGYTHCPDVCPETMARLMRVLALLSPQARSEVRILFVSVDPARDTPAAMRDYVGAFDAEHAYGLTGSERQIESLAALPRRVPDGKARPERQLRGHAQLGRLRVRRARPRAAARDRPGFPRRDRRRSAPDHRQPFLNRNPFTTQPMTLKPTLLAALAALSLSLNAHAAGAASISAQNAWVRWLPNKLPAAGYVTLVNASDKPIDLVEVDSPEYGMTMLHQTVSNGSTQKMEMVDKLTIPARGKVDIAPGGYHFMLEEPKRAIKPGDTVHLRMQFSDGEKLDAPFAVKSPAAAQ